MFMNCDCASLLKTTLGWYPFLFFVECTEVEVAVAFNRHLLFDFIPYLLVFRARALFETLSGVIMIFESPSRFTGLVLMPFLMYGSFDLIGAGASTVRFCD